MSAKPKTTFRFSGHETFPIRYGWLNKAYHAVNDETEDSASIFSSANAIVKFGVGKNMVNSIRHWALQSGILEQGDDKQLKTTPFAETIFENDPYLESISTLWALHWNLASNEELGTWYLAFNHYYSNDFEREALKRWIVRYCEDNNHPKVSPNTIKRDVECFARTYAAKPTDKKTNLEDSMESPLTELGLIKATGNKDGFRFIRGEKPTLTSGVFAYAVCDFWKRTNNANSISLEALAHNPGSPGRVFQLNEDDLVERLNHIENSTSGFIRWSETAGLRQIIKDREILNKDLLSFLETDYK